MLTKSPISNCLHELPNNPPPNVAPVELGVLLPNRPPVVLPNVEPPKPLWVVLPKPWLGVPNKPPPGLEAGVPKMLPVLVFPNEPKPPD